MCCWTHDFRDALEHPGPELMAEAEDFRCRCTHGGEGTCRRRMTAEDFLCDWCRGTNHIDKCNDYIQMPSKLLERMGYTLDGQGDMQRAYTMDRYYRSLPDRVTRRIR